MKQEHKFKLESLKEIISFLFNCAVSLVKVIGYIFLLLGALSAVLILYLSCPEIAMKIMPPFMIILSVILRVIISIIIIGIFLAAFYFMAKYFIIPFAKRQKELNEERRNKFKEEIIEGIRKCQKK